MGVFNCPISVSSLDGGESREIDATVDTGATYTVIPAVLLKDPRHFPGPQGHI